MFYDTETNKLYLGSDPGLAVLNLSNYEYVFYNYTHFDIELVKNNHKCCENLLQANYQQELAYNKKLGHVRYIFTFEISKPVLMTTFMMGLWRMHS